MTAGLLRLHHLRVSLRRGRRLLPVLDALDLNLDRGELLALVGESGSGKTTAALAVLRLLPAGATQSGHILLDGTELPGLGAQAMRQRRGRDIGMVFQNTAAALNPSLPVGRQIAEAYRLQTRASAQAGRTHALALLGEVGIVNPAARIDDVPHQFSGGMRQRVMIALALACSPSLLIADEPTSGLDPATARQTLALMARLRRERRMGVLCITHDLSMVADHADRVQVLYAGRTMEHGPAPAVFTAPRHPYSRALLAAVPRSGAARLASIHGSPPDPEHWSEICRFAPRCPDRQDDCTRLPPAGHAAATTAFCLHPGAAPAIAAIHPIIPRAATPDVILRVTDLSVAYPGTTLLARDPRIALHGVSFDLHRGECLGVVGPSGSGKSSLGRAVLQMLPYRGRMALDGQDFASLSKPAFRAQRRRIQAVFQDPAGSLNPHLGIAASIAEPLLLAGVTGATHRRRQVDALLDRVGLPASIGDARPRDLSGGQVQRAAIARALAAKADILVLDEPTSALDVSTQALLLNLLADLQASQTLSYLLISHDHAMVQFLAHRVVKLPWQASEQGQGAAPPGLLPRLPHRHGAKRRSTPDNRNSPSSREKFAL